MVKKASILLTIFCMLTLSTGRLAAQTDYIDNINSAAAVNAAGHQVIYEMNVGAFTQAGTFTAASERLDELKTLGVDIVWLMPIYPRGASGSPYAATDFKAVNAKYGTLTDLKNFVSRAHELHMEVWLDWVPNHTATEATWVTTHPEYYGYNGQQEFRHPSSGYITYNDVWQLNYYKPELRQAMNDCMKFWIDEADIDGFRCDFVSSQQIPATYWTAAIPEIKGHKSGKTITFLAEADLTDVTRLADVGFDYDYAWGFQSQLAQFKNGTSANTLHSRVNSLLTASSGKSFKRMLYLTNHDQNMDVGTLATVYGDNRYSLTVLTFTLGSMPLLYNGQETGGNQKLDYFADTKINWGNVDKKMLNTVRTLCAMKHSVGAFAEGTAVSSLSTGNSSVYAYKVSNGGSEALVVLNLSTAQATVNVSGVSAGEYGLWLNSETIQQGVSRSKVNLQSSAAVSLEAKGYKVYVKGSFSEETLPELEVYNPTLEHADEISIFFETATERDYAVWAWDGGKGGDYFCINTNWPGDPMTLMGQTATGRYVYKYVLTKTDEVPASLIISYNGGNNKVYDGVSFVNHGYYVEGQTAPTQVITTTGINVNPNTQHPTPNTQNPTPNTQHPTPAYNLQGQQIKDSQLSPGLYIRNGKKILVKNSLAFQE